MQERAPKSLPPQEQHHQPGVESKMHPRPDFEPRYAGSGRLEGKVALITGGDSGIGRATSVLFAREGANIAIVYLEEDKDAKGTASLVEQEGGECLLVKGDIGSADFCADAVKRTVKQFGQLDVLVNNAAEQHEDESVEEFSEEQLVKTFRTNLFGYFFMTQAALPHLGKGSAIVNTASITAYRGHPTHICFFASGADRQTGVT
jgi:NAD(P)-dependent dehydrogenase (short-subunit alcohol dehydrogenase family)